MCPTWGALHMTVSAGRAQKPPATKRSQTFEQTLRAGYDSAERDGRRGFWAMRPGTTQCIDMKIHPCPSLTSLLVIWPATSQENKRPFLSYTSTLPLLPKLTSPGSRTRVLRVPHHISPHHSPAFFCGQIFKEWSISVSLVYHPVT